MLTAKPDGLLAAWLKVPPDNEAEFNDWYNTEHLPQITGVQGFLNGNRYKSIDADSWYLALYDLETVNTFFSQTFQSIIAQPTPWSKRIAKLYGSNRVRNVYRRILEIGEGSSTAPPYIFVAKMDIHKDVEDEFHDWYNHEHAPALAQVPGCTRVRRFESVEGSPKFAAVYDLKAYEVLESEAWIKAREYGRTKKMRSYMTNVCKQGYQFHFGIDANPNPIQE